MNLKELKALAEHAEQGSLFMFGDKKVMWVPAKQILTLLSAIEKYEEALKTAKEYLSTVNDCAKHCDLSCNWHTPDCGMEQSFYQALTQVQKIMEGK